MRMRPRLFAVPLLLLAACGGHPLAGYWKAEAVAAPFKKIGIDFDDATDRVLAHLDLQLPNSDPEHKHENGHYTFDAASKAVTVNCKLMGDGKAESWTGTLAGETLQLTGGADTVKLVKGGKAH